MVDYAIRASFGTAGTFILDRIDDVIYAVGNGEKIEDPSKSALSTIPFVRGLINQPYSSSQYVEDFYEYTSEVKTKAAEYRSLDEDYPSDFKDNYTYINKMTKHMSSLNRIAKEIKESDLSGDQKASQLVDIITLQDKIAIATINGVPLEDNEIKMIAQYENMYTED